jgi:hypothetical protein
MCVQSFTHKSYFHHLYNIEKTTFLSKNMEQGLCDNNNIITSRNMEQGLCDNNNIITSRNIGNVL